MSGTTIYDLHGRLIRDTFGRRLNDQAAFLIFVLFHTHRIVLSAPILTDRPAALEVAAHTQRGVSEALASVWAGTDDKRANSTYWYFRWNGEWGSYGHAERLSPEEKERFDELRTQIECHPFVRCTEPED